MKKIENFIVKSLAQIRKSTIGGFQKDSKENTGKHYTAGCANVEVAAVVVPVF
jgi:hypothetical protein